MTDFSQCVASHKMRKPQLNRFDSAVPIASARNYEEFKKRVEKFRQLGKMKSHFILGVFGKKSGEFIGQIDLLVLHKKIRWGNFGYHIQNQYWGCGFATEACRIALDISFDDLRFHRLEAATDPKNNASKKVARKIGMRYEGKRLKFFPDNGGRDMMVFGVNAIDYHRERVL